MQLAALQQKEEQSFACAGLRTETEGRPLPASSINVTDWSRHKSSSFMLIVLFI